MDSTLGADERHATNTTDSLTLNRSFWPIAATNVKAFRPEAIYLSSASFSTGSSDETPFSFREESVEGSGLAGACLSGLLSFLG
jgi:hypothetical protein